MVRQRRRVLFRPMSYVAVYSSRTRCCPPEPHTATYLPGPQKLPTYLSCAINVTVGHTVIKLALDTSSGRAKPSEELFMHVVGSLLLSPRLCLAADKEYLSRRHVSRGRRQRLDDRAHQRSHGKKSGFLSRNFFTPLAFRCSAWRVWIAGYFFYRAVQHQHDERSRQTNLPPFALPAKSPALAGDACALISRLKMLSHTCADSQISRIFSCVRAVAQVQVVERT